MHHTHTIKSVPVTADTSELSSNLRAIAQSTSHPSSLLTHWTVCCLLLLALQCLPATSQAQDNDQPGGGSLVLILPNGNVDALILDADVDLQVRGLLADMTLVQAFKNTTRQWVEGRYLFPLPPDATIRGLRITVGDRTITGEVQPREEAEAVYQKASEAGQIASLVEHQRPNLFTMNLANIAPGETIRVTLDVMLPVTVVGQKLQLTLPTTLTPRYTNAATPEAQAVSSDFVQPQTSRGPRLNVRLSIAPLSEPAAVSSSTHTLEVDASGLKISNTPMDQDIILEWPAQYSQETSVHAFVATLNNERFVQLLVNPPASIDVETRVPRELVIIVDKSGSMAGVSMQAAIEALNYAIDGLTDKDFFNLVAFDDNHYPLFTQSRQATGDVKRQARRFANHLVAEGGTEMTGALSFALETGDAPVQRLRQIVFITDGSVGYEESLLSSINQQLGNSRLFTVGIGPSPNTWFLEKAAQVGRGVSVSIRDEHDVARSITELLNGLVYPLVTDIAVQYPSGNGEIYPRPLPDLYAQRPGMWIARISDAVDQVVITGTHAGERWRQTVQLPADEPGSKPSSDSSAPAIAMQWTRRKIDALLDEQRFSADRELNKPAITQLAMNAGLVTPYTSFVAMETPAIRALDEPLTKQEVANLIPKGNQMMNINTPQGAAGVDTLAWLSLMLVAGSLGMLRISRVGRH